jgi:hypothetical protein
VQSVLRCALSAVGSQVCRYKEHIKSQPASCFGTIFKKYLFLLFFLPTSLGLERFPFSSTQLSLFYLSSRKTNFVHLTDNVLFLTHTNKTKVVMRDFVYLPYSLNCQVRLLSGLPAWAEIRTGHLQNAGRWS